MVSSDPNRDQQQLKFYQMIQEEQLETGYLHYLSIFEFLVNERVVHFFVNVSLIFL